MAYCTATEVRYLVHTGLDDTALGNLITIVDADIDAKLGSQDVGANQKKLCSMLLTAVLCADRDPTTYAVGMARVTYGDRVPRWEAKAWAILRRSRDVRISWWDSEAEEVKHPE